MILWLWRNVHPIAFVIDSYASGIFFSDRFMAAFVSKGMRATRSGGNTLWNFLEDIIKE